MNVMLLGAGGMLARAIVRASPEDASLRAFTHAQLDITDAAGVESALASRPNWVINCAAWTRVDDAEDHEAEATRINGDAVGVLGQVAARHDVRVLHISTDYVFDGRLGNPYREDDAPNPQGAYGRSKLAGERALAASGCRWTLVRTQWLYGGGPSFVRTMWQRALAGLPSRVVDDQIGAPTHAHEVADVIWRLINEGAHGIWHATASGSASWFEVAQAVHAEVGADVSLVTPCSTLEFGARAPRPADGRLDTTKLGEMRPFHAVLTEALQSGHYGAAGP
ncbi:MAG: dTDP-4-dehydrorhamnose reductase [Gemmatimonadaceae bacterium]|nr:dTDP-4-dehydrorhamnose reductase [Gemmatimonadaceae bacterium]